MNSTSNKRIALISVHGDPAIEIGKEEAGGQNVYVRQVGEALSQLGWEVDMFSRKVSSDQEDICQHNSRCRTIRLTSGPVEFVPRDNGFQYLPEFVKQLLKFQKENGIKYEVVHTNYWLSSWVGLQLKKIQGSKQVHTYHSLGIVKYNTIENIPLVASQRLAVEKEVLETAERIVATSPQEKHHMKTLVSQQGNIDIIPCGTNVNHFGSVDRDTARATLGIAPDAKVVLYVGRFDPRKGIETLVRAVRESKFYGDKNLKLIIGGGSTPGNSDGRERDRIEGIVKELGMGDCTVFPGLLKQEILPNYYAAADVCVIPSHYEPFGLVAVEAMACGTPVIASDVGGLQFSVVNENTGLLVPPQDVAAFSNAIDRILENPEWRVALGRNASMRIMSKFSWDGVASQLDSLYTELLQSVKEPALVAG
ncbi:MAG: glycosyltransferase family 1 protein [Nostocales cyanobacterium]|nr:MAG: glycosyltransferase family 1 protein [Nostocales cyanobacterium]